MIDRLLRVSLASLAIVGAGCGTRPFTPSSRSSIASPTTSSVSGIETSASPKDATSAPPSPNGPSPLLPEPQKVPPSSTDGSALRDPLSFVPTSSSENEKENKPGPVSTPTVDQEPAPRTVSQVTRPSPARLVDGRYPIQSGDQLEILFHEAWEPGGEYRILPGDQVRIEFLGGAYSPSSDPQRLDRTVTVQPDGKLALPFIGVVNAAGATVPELTETLEGRYRDIYVEPELLVSLASTGHGLRDLRETVLASAGRTTVVAPDGTITVPHLGIVKVDGLNLQEAQDEINERYKRALPGFMVTVRLAGER